MTGNPNKKCNLCNIGCLLHVTIHTDIENKISILGPVRLWSVARGFPLGLNLSTHLYFHFLKSICQIFGSEWPYFSPKLQILQHMHYNCGSGNLWTSFFCFKNANKVIFKAIKFYLILIVNMKKKIIYIVWDLNKFFIDKFYSNHDIWDLIMR